MKRVLLLVICLYSCSGSSDENVKRALEYGCENKLAMVQADSLLPAVSFDLGESKSQTLNKLDSTFPDDCGPYFFFNWNNRNYSNLRLTYYDPTRCIFLIERLTTRISLNEAGQVLLEDSIVTKDLELISSSIAKQLVAYYMDKNQPGDIVLAWQDGTHLDLIDDAIDQAINGYLAAAETVSKGKFETKLCDLNTGNLEKLKKEFPFMLIINHTRKENAVPPPPSEKK